MCTPLLVRSQNSTHQRNCGADQSPGIGERKAIKNDPKATKFQKPDLAVVDVDLTGVLYTAFLAVQQMRWQEKDKDGFRGKSESFTNRN